MRLLNRHQFVGVTVDDQRGGIPLRDVGNGGGFAELLPLFNLVGNALKPILVAIVMVKIERS